MTGLSKDTKLNANGWSVPLSMKFIYIGLRQRVYYFFFF